MAEATPRKKTAAKKAPAKRSTTPRAPRKTAQTIRNLRGTVVHARLLSVNPKDPFRIALNPRGQYGDTAVIPVNLQDDQTYLKGIGVLWELITTTEARAVEYESTGYLGRTDAPQVIRPEDTTVRSEQDWDGTGRQPERGSDPHTREFGAGMHTADVPGSDQALHAKLRAAQEAGESAMPPGVDVQSRRVGVERVKGA